MALIEKVPSASGRTTFFCIAGNLVYLFWLDDQKSLVDICRIEVLAYFVICLSGLVREPGVKAHRRQKQQKWLGPSCALDLWSSS
jgi:hypothetical protein